MSEAETVWVNAGASSVYHTDPDCKSLKKANGVRDVSKDVLFDDVRACQYCSGSIDTQEYAPTGGTFANGYTGKGPGDPEEWSVCASCGGDKPSGESCEWCERYEEVMGAFA